MIIARDPRFSDAAHGQLLRPSWGTLYELTKLPDHVFMAKIASGAIHPDMQRKDVDPPAAPKNLPDDDDNDGRSLAMAIEALKS